MSLHIYLESAEPEQKECECPTCNHTHTHIFYPELAMFNVTGNLIDLAESLKIYDYLWDAEENNIQIAKQMIEPLKEAIFKLQYCPSQYKKFNPKNGWGSCEGFLKFMTQYLVACEENPYAKIRICK